MQVKALVAGLTVLSAGTVLAVAPPQAWLAPSVHFNGAVGSSSADHVEDLAVGHHDPTREDGSVQGLELGASLRTGAYLEGFATYALHYGASEEWDGEWEEAFLKLVDLPGGFEVRGGRILARFGAINATHLHGWDSVDLPLVSGLLLGDDGLILDGGDLTWIWRDRTLTFGAIAGYGSVKAHKHGDHADEHADEDDAHDDHADHEEGGWDGDVGNGRLFAIYHANDFNQWTLGTSGAVGDNGQDLSRSVLGLDLAYQWRENGLESGGRALRWTTEVMTKIEKLAPDEHDEDVHDDHAHGAEEHDVELEREATTGFYTQTVWTWNDRWDTGLRVGAVEREGERDARCRVSPALTWRPLGTPVVAMRLQYNYDDLGAEEEHTVWAQLGLSWGGGEVR